MGNNQKSIDILKGALLLEYRGKALFENAAQMASSQPVKDLFNLLTQEEDKHIQILQKQFRLVSSGEHFSDSEVDKGDYITSDTIMTSEVVRNLSAFSYEAAVVGAALDFEKNAVTYYSKHASEADTEEERKLYRWLADWEKQHMKLFATIDQELKEQVWYDNSFWPLG